MEAISGLDFSNVSRLVITLIKEHTDDTQLNFDKIIEKIKQDKGITPEFLILDHFTSSQSETIYETIIEKNIIGAIFAKDCDNYFISNIECKNSVCISRLDNKIIAGNKSYVSLDKFGHLTGIVEKTVIGDKFCVGGYSFKDANDFKLAFEEIKSLKGINHEEIYVSHIIQHLLLNNKLFSITEVSGYEDWGTFEEWKRYTSGFCTMFVDCDGVLIKSSAEFFYPQWGETNGIEKNISVINKAYDSGKATIIITTSRKEEYRQITIDQLEKLGVKYHRIIFDLPHAKRILINDYSNSNQYPTAIALNLKRDEDCLWDFGY